MLKLTRPLPGLTKEVIDSPNLCEMFDAEDLKRIGAECFAGLCGPFEAIQNAVVRVFDQAPEVSQLIQRYLEKSPECFPGSTSIALLSQQPCRDTHGKRVGPLR